MTAISLNAGMENRANAKVNRVAGTLPITPWLWRVALLAIGLWSGVLAALISLYVNPAPRVHDEFSYLLAADTLLHGRLANETPPAWEALQSFHTIMHPSYASKYPVGAGLLVAIGWTLFGTPLASSWLAAALLTISVMWMLAGVLPKRWAIVGGLLIAFSPFIQLAWAQSLLHGFLPASGSAVLLGGIVRLRRRVDVRNAVLSGCGIGMLAISRPFEGLCCTVICATLLWFTWSKLSLLERATRALKITGFAASPVIAALLLIGAHNQAATGNWRHLPYQLHEAQYGVAPLFVFDSPTLANMETRIDLPAVFHDYHAVDSLNWYKDRIGWKGWTRGITDAIRELFKLTFPFIGLIAISGLGWTRYRLTRGLMLAVALQIAASASVCWVYSHYLAPILPMLLLLALIALRSSLRSRSTAHRDLVRLSVFAVLVIQVGCIVTFAGVARTNEAESWSRRRQEIVQFLNEAEGNHLILVHYAENHNVHQEWVYNLAEPRESKIVWARFDDARWLTSVLEAYPDRSVWEINADDPKPTLRKFTRPLNQNTSDASGH